VGKRKPLTGARRRGSRPLKRSLLRRLVLRVLLPSGALLLALLTAFFRLQGIKRVTDASRAASKRGYPTMMKLAGSRYFFAGVIRHTGRRSGREYATPVWALATSDGFLISLPFGESVDWLKNVLASGQATVETRGETWAVAQPEVIGREIARPLLPLRARLLFGMAGIERYLMLRRLS
jgi:deazaflavin-dependent oxidoreductase (nitroreductase family)